MTLKETTLGHAMVVMVFAAQFVMPQPVATATAPTIIRQADASVVMLSGEKLAKAQDEWKAKQNAPKPTVAVRYMTVSAYNSLPNQTDASPYSTAIGSLTREGVIAANYLPMGTRVRIPDHFGDHEFRVEDRLNPRYTNNIDVWMEDYKTALKFGRRYSKIEIVEWGKGRGVE